MRNISRFRVGGPRDFCALGKRAGTDARQLWERTLKRRVVVILLDVSHRARYRDCKECKQNEQCDGDDDSNKTWRRKNASVDAGDGSVEDVRRVSLRGRRCLCAYGGGACSEWRACDARNRQ